MGRIWHEGGDLRSVRSVFDWLRILSLGFNEHPRTPIFIIINHQKCSLIFFVIFPFLFLMLTYRCIKCNNQWHIESIITIKITARPRLSGSWSIHLDWIHFRWTSNIHPRTLSGICQVIGSSHQTQWFQGTALVVPMHGPSGSNAQQHCAPKCNAMLGCTAHPIWSELWNCGRKHRAHCESCDCYARHKGG